MYFVILILRLFEVGAIMFKKQQQTNSAFQRVYTQTGEE